MPVSNAVDTHFACKGQLHNQVGSEVDSLYPELLGGDLFFPDPLLLSCLLGFLGSCLLLHAHKGRCVLLLLLLSHLVILHPMTTMNQFQFPVFRTHQGSQQTVTGRLLRMSKMNNTTLAVV